MARRSVLYVSNGPDNRNLAHGYMQTRYYELSWSLSCTYKNLRSRLPVMLEYMSSNGCEWIVKISPQDKPNSYVEVLVTREGKFWPVFIFDTDSTDEKTLNMDKCELVPNLEWEWPSAWVQEDAHPCDEPFNISSAISGVVVHSLERVFHCILDDVFELMLFNVRCS